uniref:IF rod domain-containing protein n=1 Tax=Oncorhynchus kisutch TaxID=8019 RepID=A0A8C7CQ04_ONCKI
MGKEVIVGASGFSGGLGGGGMALALRYGMGLGAGAQLGLSGGMGMGNAGLGLEGGGGYGDGMGMGSEAGLGVGEGGGYGAGMGMGMGGGGGYRAGMGLSMGGGSAYPAAGPVLAPVLLWAAEKHTLSGLNERFSGYMAKVRQLQQENVSTGATTTTAENEIQLIENRGKLERLTLDTVKLEMELDCIRGTAHEMKAEYDFEQGVRYQLESDIATMRRDIDMARNLRIELDAKHSSLRDELDFITKTQDEELFTIQSKLGTSSTDTSVSMIEGDPVKSFDIASALNKIRVENEKSVEQHKEKEDAYYKIKLDEVQAANATSSEALTTSKAEISASRKELQALSLELQSLVNMNMSLELSFAQSSGGVAEYQNQFRGMDEAIDVAKVDLHKQILSYQELLDVQLVLDAEITTYRTLLNWDDLSMSFTKTSYTYTGEKTV